MSEERQRPLDLFDSHALGVLEGDERAELESRLAAGEPEAEQALAEANALVAQLAWAAEEHDPHERVKEGLMARVRDEAPRPAAQPIEFPKPRRSWAPLAWAIAAGLAVVAFLGQEQVSELRDEVARLEQRRQELASENETYAGEAERYRRILAILSAPETRAVSLNAPENPRIHAYWNEQLGLVLAGDEVPAPAEGRELQLWAIPNEGAPVSVGVFVPNSQGRALFVTEPAIPPSRTQALAVTDEPAGGSAGPTTQPIWVGPLG